MGTKKIAEIIIEAFKSGNHLYIIGNGGSATMSSHMAGELVGKFKYNRKALPAMALTNSSIITAIGNDLGFEYIFSRQIEALGKPGDVLLILSTSGKSENCIMAINKAEEMGLKVIDFPREGSETPYVQELQLIEIHEVCRTVEKAFK